MDHEIRDRLTIEQLHYQRLLPLVVPEVMTAADVEDNLDRLVREGLLDVIRRWRPKVIGSTNSVREALVIGWRITSAGQRELVRLCKLYP